LTSPQQLTKGFTELGIDTGKYGTTGMSTDSEALHAVLAHAHGDPEMEWVEGVVGPVLAHRKAIKRQGYLVGYRTRSVKGILYPSWHWPGTETQRLRSSDPNVQNIPRGDTRRTFKSRYADGAIVKGDFGQAELRWLAFLSRDPVMLQIYAEGLDIHGHTATRVWGKAYTKANRETAKRINFGVIYGMSPERLQLVLRTEGIYLTLQECKHFILVWQRTYPVAWSHMRSVQEIAARTREVPSPLGGYVRHLEETQGKRLDQLAREGANAPIQSAASLMTLRSAVDLVERLPPEALLVNIVHDEIVLDVPGRLVPDVARLLRETMLSTAADLLPVPMAVDVEAGPNWGDTEGIDAQGTV
jgi:DNA polymerase-1